MNTQIANIQNTTTSNVIASIITAKNQIAYNESSIAPYYGEMAAWEAKEYQQTHSDNVAELSDLTNHMMANESIFNNELSKYGISTAVFIALLNNN